MFAGAFQADSADRTIKPCTHVQEMERRALPWGLSQMPRDHCAVTVLGPPPTCLVLCLLILSDVSKYSGISGVT